jgi:hypothetical protein
VLWGKQLEGVRVLVRVVAEERQFLLEVAVIRLTEKHDSHRNS